MLHNNALITSTSSTVGTFICLFFLFFAISKNLSASKFFFCLQLKVKMTRFELESSVYCASATAHCSNCFNKLFAASCIDVKFSRHDKLPFLANSCFDYLLSQLHVGRYFHIVIQTSKHNLSHHFYKPTPKIFMGPGLTVRRNYLKNNSFIST